MRKRRVGGFRQDNFDTEFFVKPITEAAAPPATSEAPRRIAMLIYPGVAPLDVAGPLQVFGFSNFLMKRQLYEIFTVAPTAQPVATGLGFAFLPVCAMKELPLPVDTLLVSGGGGPDAVHDPEILDWLRQTAPKARRYGSICTGVFVLANAGLIDGKRVTTHWALGAELAQRNPTAKVEADSIFVRDGRLYSSAGISAGIDLALALLEEDHGRDFALKVARYLVLFLKRSGGQAQFSTLLQSQFSSIPAIQKLQHWCHENLDGDLRVPALAKRVSMSERSFIRTFREDTGRTPAEFVISIRLQEARRLLEETNVVPKVVAQRCGLGNAAAMRRIFVRELGVSPGEYRGRFYATATAAARPSIASLSPAR
jgi:transcriptional regulator GlxA family with amidase domain